MRSLLLVAAVALLAMGCFSPVIEDGAVPCGPAGECPSSFRCDVAAGRCTRAAEGTAIDAPIVLPPDADGANATADAPPVSDGPLGDSATGTDGGTTVNLIIAFTGDGNGTVNIGTASCTRDCTLGFARGTAITLTAAPSGSSNFLGWRRACSGTDPCSLTLTSDTAIDAIFGAMSSQVTVSVALEGPGSVSFSPAGVGCGVGCAAFAKNASVTITPRPNEGFSFLGWIGGECESQPGACTLRLTSSRTLTAQFCPSHIVVDPRGADDQAGTCRAPFKTITKALSVATTGQTVAVRSGRYDSSSGEVFPLIVPAGVSLIGDEPNRGNATQTVFLTGDGLVPGSTFLKATVVVAKDATLAGFLITSSDELDGNGVVTVKLAGVDPNGATIRSCTITGNRANGIYVDSGSGVRITNNIIKMNRATGVRVQATALDVRLESNTITRNGFGVELSSRADLGGSGGSAGGNEIACNTHFDLLATGLISVAAQGNGWDHAPPSASCEEGGDICAVQGATVLSGGAVPAGEVCP